MRTIAMILAASVALVAEALAADSGAKLSSPILGYVFDAASKSIRPIAGVPGAADLEAALPSASKIEAAFVSPNREFLLAATIEGASLIDLRSWNVKELPDAPADVALGAWSPDGSSVALWSRSGTLQLWGGLPDEPQVRFVIEIDAPAGLVTSEGGQSVLFWNDSGLRIADASGLRQLASEAVISAAFRPRTSDWAALTASQLLRSNAEPAPIPVETAKAVAFTAGGRIVVAGAKAVALIEEQGARTIECDCDATALERLAGVDVFRLTGLDAPSIAIFDGDSAEPRIVLIPTQGGRN